MQPQPEDHAPARAPATPSSVEDVLAIDESVIHEVALTRRAGPHRGAGLLVLGLGAALCALAQAMRPAALGPEPGALLALTLLALGLAALAGAARLLARTGERVHRTLHATDRRLLVLDADGTLSDFAYPAIDAVRGRPAARPAGQFRGLRPGLALLMAGLGLAFLEPSLRLQPGGTFAGLGLALAGLTLALARAPGPRDRVHLTLTVRGRRHELGALPPEDAAKLWELARTTRPELVLGERALQRALLPAAQTPPKP